MSKLPITGIDIKVTDTDQVLNMGGPWIGDLLVNEKFVSDNCIVDNFVFDEKRQLLFFIKFHVITKFYFYFTINFYNIGYNTVFEFEREFSMVYLKQLINENGLEIFNAFHGQNLQRRDLFCLDSENFYSI